MIHHAVPKGLFQFSPNARAEPAEASVQGEPITYNYRIPNGVVDAGKQQTGNSNQDHFLYHTVYFLLITIFLPIQFTSECYIIAYSLQSTRYAMLAEFLHDS